MSMTMKLLRQFISEEVWRAVSRSAGLVGGMNIGKYSGETVTPVPHLGNDENEEEETEKNSEPRGNEQHIIRQRR